MYLKNLQIYNEKKIIRSIDFKSGLNLILDNTDKDFLKDSGNNIGKTTVLKLIDYCLGAKASVIYSDPENEKNIDYEVQSFLVENNVNIKLTLTSEIENKASTEVVLIRNFLEKNKSINSVNGHNYPPKDYKSAVSRAVFPNLHVERPTFREIISHNIRYNDYRINNTLRTISPHTNDICYETLHLFMLGINKDNYSEKTKLESQINKEKILLSKLTEKETKNGYITAKKIVEDQIFFLNEKKRSLNLNKDFDEDLTHLNKIKYEITTVGKELSGLNIRKKIIDETKEELNRTKTDIDIVNLKSLYSEITSNVDGLNKKFEDLVQFHNSMIDEKVRYISAELPNLKKRITKLESRLVELKHQELHLTEKISGSISFATLESIIKELSQLNRTCGEYDSMIKQIEECEKKISSYTDTLKKSEEKFFSGNFEATLNAQCDKFNNIFSLVSQKLYGETFALKYDVSVKRRKSPVYKFSTFNVNISSGKKQGEIVCFDLAYIQFADQEKIPCLHFLLNDKKELMHGNQLLEIADYLKSSKIQIVMSILKDKIPNHFLEKSHVAVELSSDDKLFRF